MAKMDEAEMEMRVRRMVLLGVLRMAAQELVDLCEDDPLLYEWALSVELAAQQFEAVPVAG